MNTGRRPVNGEPARTALRGTARLLEVARVDFLEAGLQVGEARQRAAGRDDALSRRRAHVAVGHDPPRATSALLRALRHDALHALDAAQGCGNIRALRL